jgi:hypothetical protein
MNGPTIYIIVGLNDQAFLGRIAHIFIVIKVDLDYIQTFKSGIEIKMMKTEYH